MTTEEQDKYHHELRGKLLSLREQDVSWSAIQKQLPGHGLTALRRQYNAALKEQQGGDSDGPAPGKARRKMGGQSPTPRSKQLPSSSGSPDDVSD